jgi:uncharacterized membrane protein
MYLLADNIGAKRMIFGEYTGHETSSTSGRALELARRTDASKYRSLLVLLATTALVYLAFGSLVRFVLETPYSDLRLILGLPLLMNGLTWFQLAMQSFFKVRVYSPSSKYEESVTNESSSPDEDDVAEYLLRKQIRRENLAIFACAGQLTALALVAFFVLTRGRF